MAETEGSKLAATAARHAEQRLAIVAAVVGATQLPEEVAAVAAHHAIMALANVLDEEAEALKKAKVKGNVSMGTELRGGAGRARAYAIKLPGAITAPVEPLPLAESYGNLSDQALVAESEARVAAAREEARRLLADDGGHPAMFVEPGSPNAQIPAPRLPDESEVRELQPAMVAGFDGSMIPALSIAETITPPVPSLIDDPFQDPGGYTNIRRLSYGEYRKLAATLAPAENMSVSKVQSFGTCGMQYGFERMANRGAIESARPQWANIGGNAFHAWASALERAHWAGAGQVGWTDTMSVDTLERWWLDYLHDELNKALAETENRYTIHDIRASNKGKEGYDWWRVEGARMIQRYLAYHNDAYRATWETVTLGAQSPDVEPYPALEVEFWLDFNAGGSSTDSVVSHGFIDIIRRHKFSELIRVDDFKTGRTMGSKFQLASYGHAAMRVFGLPSPVVSNWDARAGEYSQPRTATALYSWADLEYDYTTAAAMDRQRMFIAQPSFLCRGCSFEPLCPKSSVGDQ